MYRRRVSVRSWVPNDWHDPAGQRVDPAGRPYPDGRWFQGGRRDPDKRRDSGEIRDPDGTLYLAGRRDDRIRDPDLTLYPAGRRDSEGTRKTLSRREVWTWREADSWCQGSVVYYILFRSFGEEILDSHFSTFFYLNSLIELRIPICV